MHIIEKTLRFLARKRVQRALVGVLALAFVAFFGSTRGTPATIASEGDLHRVVRVVDGDTFIVETDDGSARVRLIGVDAPESVDPRKPVECFGKEASAYLHALLEGTRVRIVADPSQDERDRYDRLLRYAFLEDGRSVNHLLIEEGYAQEYTYRTPYERQREFRAAARDAKAAHRGLWADGVCAH